MRARLNHTTIKHILYSFITPQRKRKTKKVFNVKKSDKEANRRGERDAKALKTRRRAARH